jgi:hypothetical protein
MVRGATTTHPTSYPTWYLAEGTSNWGFSTYITIENPNRVPVSARITYMTPKVQVPGGTVNMPPESQVTVNPANTVGVTDFSTKVSCLEGKTICVDRTMSWTGTGAPAPEEHSSVGVNRPSRTWYLPEGSSKWGFETWLLIQNPNPTEATCTVTYMIEGGGQQKFTKRVPANSRRTYNMADDIREADASIMVESDIPVIPERSMYRNNRREGHDSIGTTKPARDYFLAEGTTDWGFTTYVTVQNPNEQPAEVTVTYMREDGPQVQPPFPMPANSRKTIRVNDVPGMGSADFSTKVNGSLPIIAERSMYWNNGTGEACHDSVGTASAHGTFYLPDGQTSQGGETYTTVQNPNSTPVNVEITYMTPSGEGNVVFSDTIPARSRRTYNMADKGISGRAAVMVTSRTGGQGIICERSMYWGRRSAGTSTIGGYSN